MWRELRRHRLEPPGQDHSLGRQRQGRRQVAQRRDHRHGEQEASDEDGHPARPPDSEALVCSLGGQRNQQGDGHVSEQEEPARNDVFEDWLLTEQRPREPAVGVLAEGQGDAQCRDGHEEPHPAIAPPKHDRQPRHDEGAEAEVLPGEVEALRAADPVGEVEEADRGRHRDDKCLERRTLDGERDGRPHPTRDVCGSEQGEPRRIGEQHEGDQRGDPKADRRVAQVSHEHLSMTNRGERHDDQEGRAEDQRADQEHLGADEELERDQDAEQDPADHRATSLGAHQAVEDGHHQWRDRGHPQHQVGIVQAHQHHRREAVEHPCGERCRGPGHEPAGQHVHGQRAQGRGQQQRHVERRHRSEEPRHRHERHSHAEHARVGEQVGPGRIAHCRREERREPV